MLLMHVDNWVRLSAGMLIDVFPHLTRLLLVLKISCALTFHHIPLDPTPPLPPRDWKPQDNTVVTSK